MHSQVDTYFHDIDIDAGEIIQSAKVAVHRKTPIVRTRRQKGDVNKKALGGAGGSRSCVRHCVCRGSRDSRGSNRIGDAEYSKMDSHSENEPMEQALASIPRPPYHAERTDKRNYSTDASCPQSGSKLRVRVFMGRRRHEIIDIRSRQRLVLHRYCLRRKYSFDRVSNGRRSRRCKEWRQRPMMICHRKRLVWFIGGSFLLD
mmetsp:Transcript_12554/g.31628  ORF Transcript_12554/g.31628 Transcript_12554/m.31628 type:complete len:202 (+) Transcript_12554:985-1590(+)